MTTRLYVETSAVLRVLLDGDERLRSAIEEQTLFTSTLTFVEAARAIARACRDARLTAEDARGVARQLAILERRCDLIAIDEDVLRRARLDFPVEPLRTLDAIHLASLRIVDEELGGFSVLSCDDRVRRNARALGFPVLPADP